MSAAKTCLILGAGASKPYGYPLGRELKTKIIEYCCCPPPECAPPEKRDATHTCLKKFAQRFKQDTNSSTIDRFLNTLDSRNPEEYELKEHGRMALAAVLGACEDPSHQVSDWYELLADILPHYSADKPLSIVTFNYDRSLEFLVSKKLGEIRPHDTSKLSAVYRIKHVYGILANLPGSNIEFEVAYGGFNGNGWYPWKSREELRFIWDAPPKDTLEVCHRWIGEAEYVVILGFGYDPENVQRLKLTELCAGKHVFSSGYHIDSVKRTEIRTGCPTVCIHWGHEYDLALDFLKKTEVLEWAAQGRAAADLMRHLAPK